MLSFLVRSHLFTSSTSLGFPQVEQILVNLLLYQRVIKIPEKASVLKLLLPLTDLVYTFSDGKLHP